MSDPLELTRRLYLGQMTTGMTGLALSRLLMSDLGAAVPPGAHFNPTAARVDKDARLLWRFPPRRLGADRPALPRVIGLPEIRGEHAAGSQAQADGLPGLRMGRHPRDLVS